MSKIRALLISLSALAAFALAATPAAAQTSRVVAACPAASTIYVVGQFGQSVIDTAGNTCGGGSAASIVIGNVSTATSLANSSTNIGSVSYNYGYDGTVWRQIEAILNTGALYDLGVHDTAVITAINQGVGTSGATAPANIIYLGCRAATASPTAVTDGQLVGSECGEGGKNITLPYAIKENALAGAASGTSGAIALTGMGAQGASIKIYITSCQAFRTDAGSTLVYVSLNDSATTTIPLPAGGGSNPVFGVPLSIAANTGVTFTPSATITSAFLSCQGYKGP